MEHYLWPERATDALRVRLSEALRLLADLARSGIGGGKEVTTAEVDAWRQRIALKVAEIQALIESSKFEPHDLDIGALEGKTADAQIVLVLLTLARHQRDPGLSEEIRARAREIDRAVAKTLEALASRAARIPGSPTPDLDAALAALEGSVADLPEIRAGASAVDDAPLGLYRSLAATIKQLSSEPLTSARASGAARKETSR